MASRKTKCGLKLISAALMGWWTDRSPSRRLPFLIGLIILLASTILMWLAKPISLQVVSRIGQGVTDAMLYIVGMTIILDTVSVSRIAEYMGYVTWSLNVGTFAGPLLGGVVFDRSGYHAMWWMMLGFVLLDVLLRTIMLERTKTPVIVAEGETINHSSAKERSNAIEIPKSPAVWLDASKTDGVSDLVQDPANTATALNLEPGIPTRTSKLPALLTLLTSMRMIVALYGICVQSMIFSGFETVVSLYVQEIWGYTSLGAGLMFIPLTVPAFFGPLIGRVIDRTNPRWALISGFLGLCPVLVACKYVEYDSMGQKVLMSALLFLIGLGITVALNPLMAEISYVAEDESKDGDHLKRTNGYGGGAYGQAWALFAMAWSVGNITGPLWCGLIKDRAGWSTMCWALGLLSGTTAVPCFIWSGEGLQGWPFSSLRHRKNQLPHSHD